MKKRKRSEPWKALGLTRNQFYYQLRKGTNAFEYSIKKYGQRYSGQSYENSKEKLMEIREKYKNGVPAGTIEMMLGGDL